MQLNYSLDKILIECYWRKPLKFSTKVFSPISLRWTKSFKSWLDILEWSMNKNLFSVHKFLANVFTSDMREFIKSLHVFIHPENTKENLCICRNLAMLAKIQEQSCFSLINCICLGLLHWFTTFVPTCNIYYKRINGKHFKTFD